MASRVAKALANSKKEENMFRTILQNRLFVPNSPMLMNAGTNLEYYSACLVLAVDDDLGEIFKTAREGALVTKAGAGTGYFFSRLRPKGDRVKSTQGKSSGVVSFMELFDVTTEVVRQGGRRKGANMGLLRIDHPDIEDFIDSKNLPNKKSKQILSSMKDILNSQQYDYLEKILLEQQLSNFNLSVGITDDFMKSVKTGSTFDLVNPRNDKVVKTVDARELMTKIAKSIWKSGEPGVVFLDEVNRKHPLKEEIEGVNVCGEQPLLPYEQCVLGALNLGRFVTEENNIDWALLQDVIKFAVTLLDNAIDKNQYPVDKIREMAMKYRKIGIGVMGWHELLIKLGLPYESKEALKLAEKVSSFINNEALKQSERLGEVKGVPEGLKAQGIERRNAVVTTVAPTGSRSILMNTTGGIEPIFNKDFYTHTDEQGNITEFDFDWLNHAGQEIKGATEMSPEEHIKMQAAWQKHVGASISKTINLPERATVKEVEDAIILAYELKCKGLTLYRNNSRDKQVLNSSLGKMTSPMIRKTVKVEPLKKIADAKRFVLKTGCGTMYFFAVINEQGEVIETFTETGHGGGCEAFTEGLSRITSIALRGGLPIEEIINQLKKIRCSSFMHADDTDKGLSCPSAIAYKLEDFITETEEKEIDTSVCPECGQKLSHDSGCVTCYNCGWSQCG